jgi:guanylate kinase
MTRRSAQQPGLLLVISGPSGVGKTTIVREIERRLGGVFSVSATTRPKTPADVEGKDYDFITEDEFRRRLAAGEFLEYAQVFGRHWYGTPRGPVERALAQGQLSILEIDVQGALQVKEKMPEAFMLFILPPSEEDLLLRLRRRGRDNEEAIGARYAEAQEEIRKAQASGKYDAFIVNDELSAAVDEACALVEARFSAT